MDFEEVKDQPPEINKRKNRLTLLALFSMFILPVAIAYFAYFNGWFDAASKNQGELLTEENILDIEDFKFTREDGNTITGKEFETIYWWVMPIDPATCDAECLDLNLYMLNQTYVGLGKESSRLNPLLVLPNGTDADTKKFPLAYSEFSNVGVKALAKTRSGLGKDLQSNFIYLVDPLGNIFMRYPLVESKEKAPKTSKDLRSDLKRLFKFSRLG